MPFLALKSQKMWSSPTVLLKYSLTFLNNIHLIKKDYKKSLKLHETFVHYKEFYPKLKLCYTSAACDACEKYHAVTPGLVDLIMPETEELFSRPLVQAGRELLVYSQVAELVGRMEARVKKKSHLKSRFFLPPIFYRIHLFCSKKLNNLNHFHRLNNSSLM